MSDKTPRIVDRLLQLADQVDKKGLEVVADQLGRLAIETTQMIQLGQFEGQSFYPAELDNFEGLLARQGSVMIPRVSHFIYDHNELHIWQGAVHVTVSAGFKAMEYLNGDLTLQYT